MNTEKIGNFIAKKRKEKNLTQRELATKIGVTDRAVSKWERGMGCPDVTLLEDVSVALDISIVELLNGEEMEDPTIIEKDLIKSMNYSKSYTKEKIKNSLNTILVTIIVFISTILIFANIINSYLLNISYEVTHARGIEHTITNIEVLSNRILNDQGIYSDEDYKKIVSHINKVNEILGSHKTKEYLFKDKYSMRDYYEFEEYLNKEMEYFLFESKQNNKYKLLLKYDSNIVEKLLTYQLNSSFSDSRQAIIQNHIANSYKYGIHLDDVNMPVNFLQGIYLSEYALLSDIIEVGEINE